MFKKRLDNSLALLKDLGLSRMNYAPMFYRLFWLLNIPVPPPHFRSFRANLFTTGGFFILLFGAFMWLTRSSAEGAELRVLFLTFILGPLFGLAMAYGYKRAKIKYDLPSWEMVDDK